MLIESFHVGKRGRRRYCSLHRPTTRLVRSTGVVLCYPLGHEYFRSHRLYVKLADQLAKLGFPVMRFDYLGTGDSEGDAGHPRLEGWLVDIAETAEELVRSEQVSNVALGGLRLGGFLAQLAAERVPSARTLILWDTIADGDHYLAELSGLHDRMSRDLERFPRPRNECADAELLGMNYGSAFRDDLCKASVPSSTPLEDIIVINPDMKPGDRRPNVRVHEYAGGGDYGWQDSGRIEEVIVDPVSIRQVATAMNTVHA